jgi:acyl-CoA thioesterase-1
MLKKSLGSIAAIVLFLFSLAAFAADHSSPTKVACVGDSITHGGGVTSKTSYPAQLGAALGEHWRVENFGVSGATLMKRGDKPYWEQDRYQAALAFKPDVVVIKLGTNDSKAWNWEHKADYVRNYVELIQSFQKLESKPVVWIAYPVPAYSGAWGISGAVIENEIKPLIDEVAKQTNVKIIDLFSALSGKKELFPDGIHPDAGGAKLIAETVASAITAASAHVTSEQLLELYSRPSPFENVSPERYVAESENAFAIRDKHPQAPVHLLVVPKKRVPTILQASPELIAEMFALAKRVAKLEGLENDGFRIVINTHPMGGQGVYHFHIHVLGGRQMEWPPG